MENASSRYYTEPGCERIGRFFVPDLTATCMVMAIRLCEEHNFLMPRWRIRFGYELQDAAEDTIGYLRDVMTDCECCSSNLDRALRDLETTVTMSPSIFENQVTKAESEKLLRWYVSVGLPEDVAAKQAKWSIDCLFRERETREKLLLQGLDISTASIQFPNN